MSQINDAFGRPLFEAMRGTPPPTWEQTCLKLSEEKRELQERIKRAESFINRFLDPEDLGYVVNNYVRDDAREALGRERVESGDEKDKP